MKIILIAAILVALSGCRGLTYDEQDYKDDIRQDALGFFLGLDGHSETDYSPSGLR